MGHARSSGFAGRGTLGTFAWLAVLCALTSIGCPGGQGPGPLTGPAPSPGPVDTSVHASKSGLGFRLSDPTGADENSTPAPVTKGTPLAKDAADRILSRVPALEDDPSLAKSFALRASTQPAPRTGKTVLETFPPPPTDLPIPAPAAAGPLRVLRHAPDGDVPLAPELSITFSQPMIPVTSHGELAKTAPPVTLSPLPKGEWQWIGTQTVLFRPEKRFAMATSFSVEVPAGTKSENGGSLSEPTKWTFATPPPSIVDQYPESGPTPTDQLVFLTFDQAIDQAAVLATVHLKAGGKSMPVRLATPAEIEADATARLRVEKADAGRWIAFRATDALPVASSIDIDVGPGTPSAEGPRTTTKAQSLNFATYGAMTLHEHHCGYDKCTPLDSWSLEFTNPIDKKKFDRKWIHVSPDLPSERIVTSGSYLTITGRPHGRTTYKVTIDGALADTFGQTMGKDATVKFDVGSAEPEFFVEDTPMQVLDPAVTSKLTLYSINEPLLRVHLYAVEPKDYPAYIKYRDDWDRDGRLGTPPGRLVASPTLRPKGDADEITQTVVDLKSALKDGVGQMILVADTAERTPKYSGVMRVWLQATHLGLSASFDPAKIVGWATDLATGAPQSGVDVSLLGSSIRGTTGADGVATLALTTEGGGMVTAKRGNDVAILPATYGDVRYSLSTRSSTTRWFTFDDRRMYKPGEEVHVKAFVRQLGLDQGGDIGGYSGDSHFTWLALDARRAEIAHGEGTIDPNGQTDIGFKLADNVNLGHATVSFAVGSKPIEINDSYGAPSHGFEVQEFRRPEFEVNASTSDGDHVVGGHAEATVAATYFAGGGLPNAQVDWSVTRSLGSFTPPNRADYRFGDGTGEGFSWFGGRMHSSGDKDALPTSATWAGKTAGTGKHTVRVDFDSLPDAYPMNLSFVATVTDVNRQAWTARTSMLVHPADVYVGVTSSVGFVHAGDPIPVDAIVVDRDGVAVPGRGVDIELAALVYEENDDGQYQAATKVVDKCHLTSTADAQNCKFKTGPDGGQYRVTATTTDVTGRRTQTRFDLWAWGGKMPRDRRLAAESVRVVPDKKTYEPGSTAELLLLAPFDDAEALVTLRRQGIVDVQRVTFKGRAATVHVHLDEANVPMMSMHVIAVGSSPRKTDDGDPDPSQPKMPAYATGDTTLDILPTARTLKITVAPRASKVDPGASTSVAVEVKLANGAPAVGTELALMVVDEAVLALTHAELPDPIAYFYDGRSSDTNDMELRQNVHLAEPNLAAAAGLGAMGYGAGGGGMARAKGAPGGGMTPAPAPPSSMAQPAASAAAPMMMDEAEAVSGALRKVDGTTTPPPAIALRTDFSALAAFVPHLVIGANGKADVPVKLPDNLTRYRVMVVATHGTKEFGAEESTITARLPLMVRPSPPRFLNFGDVFELPVVLQNQTDAAMDVDVAARAKNAVIAGTGAVRVHVPANDRVEVRLPTSAAHAGTARFQVAATSEQNVKVADANLFELPVWTPATTEAFATYGTLDDAPGGTAVMAQPLKMPNGVVTEFGDVEITTSSTALQALTDALLYIVHYPYECDEQISDRILAIAALRDVLTAFQVASMPTPEALNDSMTKDFARLKLHQRSDGGFGYWALSEEDPYVTIHVANALARAKGKGYAVPADTMQRVLSYLQNIDQHFPSWYDKETRRALRAYSLDVRARMGDIDRAHAKGIIDEVKGADHLPLELLGFLLPVLSGDAKSQSYVDQIRHTLANHVTETAGAAHFVTSYGDGDTVLLNSDHRADGIILEALIGDQPNSDLIPKVVAGLLASKKAGHWHNTNEDAFVLLALDRYFATAEKVTPDFVARAWLGDQFAGDHAFKGRTTERDEIDVPMATLATVASKSSNGQTNITLSKTGAGRMYYRLGMKYAPADLRPPPSDHGFAVTRTYEPIDNPSDVTKTADGVWHVKSGASVRVRVTMAAQAERAHVALVDPLPAGLEAVNPSLAISPPVEADPKARAQLSPWWYWQSTWYEHQNMRDERVEAFASQLSAGVYEYSYVARATTPGTWVVPPPKAEEMYNPETFGRGAGDRLIVE